MSSQMENFSWETSRTRCSCWEKASFYMILMKSNALYQPWFRAWLHIVTGQRKSKNSENKQIEKKKKPNLQNSNQQTKSKLNQKPSLPLTKKLRDIEALPYNNFWSLQQRCLLWSPLYKMRLKGWGWIQGYHSGYHSGGFLISHQ